MDKSAGGFRTDGYIVITIDCKQYKAHRLAWLYMYGTWPKNHIDHLNGVRNDNRIENLRDADDQINMENRTRANKNNKSTGVQNVYLNKETGKYDVMLQINGVLKRFGSYESLEKATLMAIEMKRKHHKGCTI